MLTAQKSCKPKNSEKNRIPEEVFALYVLFQDSPSPVMMSFFTYLPIIEKLPKIQKSRSYDTWALDILPQEGGKLGPAMS
jgi:hypothetical protein